MSTYKQPDQRQVAKLAAAGLAGLIAVSPVAAIAAPEPDEAADTQDYVDTESGEEDVDIDTVPRAAPPLVSRVQVPFPNNLHAYPRYPTPKLRLPFSHQVLPIDLMIEGEHGVVRAELDVDNNGRVATCIGTGNSQILQTLSCEMLSRDLRFNPAMDQRGNPIASKTSYSIVWHNHWYNNRTLSPRLQTEVEIAIDDLGRIHDCKIVRTSGDAERDGYYCQHIKGNWTLPPKPEEQRSTKLSRSRAILDKPGTPKLGEVVLKPID